MFPAPVALRESTRVPPIRVLAIAALALMALPAAARGDAVIYYSAPGAGYGWCANTGSRNATKACALAQCQGAGNSDCQLALDCDDGWAAVAIGESSAGAGAVCERASSTGARNHALLLCMAAAGELCWTDAVFLGSNELARSANRAFDEAWYAQVLLGYLGFDPGAIDGEMGSRTREAIRAFQSSAGLPVDGTLDRALIDALVAKVGGVDVLADEVRKGIEPRRDPALARTEFMSAPATAGGGGGSSRHRNEPGR